MVAGDTKKSFDFNKERLKEIREYLGFSLEDASTHIKAKFKDKKKSEILEGWEDGSINPTFNQVKILFDKTYYYPFFVLYEKKIPKGKDILVEYRTPGNKLTPIKKRILNKLQYEILDKQSTLSIIADEEDWPDLDFVGYFKTLSENLSPKNLRNNTLQIVEKIHNLLDISHERPIKHIQGKLFKTLQEKIENINVYVFQLGNLSTSTHENTKLETEDFRGMFFPDPKVPILVINSHDADAAKLFTLIHEFCHLLIGNQALYTGNSFKLDYPHSFDQKEILCDEVASEFFVPKEQFLKDWNESEKENLDERIKDIATKYKMSPVTIALKAFKNRYITKAAYTEYYETYNKAYLKYKDDQKKKPGGPSFYVSQNNKFGKKYIKTVASAYHTEIISWADALHAVGYDIDKFGHNS